MNDDQFGDDADLTAAYGRLVAGVEAPHDAVARVARRRTQRRRRTAAVGVGALAAVAALGLGGSLVLGGDEAPQGEVAVDPAGREPAPVAQAESTWPTEVTCPGGTQPQFFLFDSLRRPLAEIAGGQGPVHFDRATLQLFQLRADRTAYKVLQLEYPRNGSYLMGGGEQCRDRTKPVVSEELECPTEERDGYVTRAAAIEGMSAIEVAEEWSGDNLVALSRDGATAYALRPDGSTSAQLGVMGSRDAHAVTQAEFCVGERGLPEVSDPVPPDRANGVTCEQGEQYLTFEVDAFNAYPTFTAFLRAVSSGPVHHSADRTRLLFLRPDGSAYRMITTSGAAGGWNTSTVTACDDFSYRAEGPTALSCSGALNSGTLEYFTQAPPEDLSIIEAAEEYSDGRPVALSADGETVRVVRQDGTASAELLMAGDDATGFYVSGVTHCNGEPRPGSLR